MPSGSTAPKSKETKLSVSQKDVRVRYDGDYLTNRQIALGKWALKTGIHIYHKVVQGNVKDEK